MIQNKYIIRLSLIGLFLNIIVNMIFYRYFMIEEMIRKQVSKENVHIAELYTKYVWNKYPSVMYKLHHTSSYKSLLQDQDFIKFAVHSSDWFRNVNAHISLYDLQGNKFITSSSLKVLNLNLTTNDNDTLYEKIFKVFDRYFLQNTVINEALHDSFYGITTHLVLPRVLVEIDGEEEKLSYVRSYIPIIGSNLYKFPVDIILEINTNVTQQWQNIKNLEQKVFITFTTVFLIICTIIMSNTNYAQRVIDQQFEINRSLNASLVKVKDESSAHTQFFAHISHELRTPLNAIIGFSEIMISNSNNQKYNNEYIKDINSAGKHLLSVINDILDLSKASVDKLQVDHVELDLNKLITSTIRLMKPRADESKVQLIENLPEEHIIIKADPKRLKQVFLNLLSNGVKFTHAGGTVTVEIKKNENEKIIYIIVKDTGIGINEKDIPRTLSTFGQIDTKLSRKYEGTGLGLPLTKKLVELMHGKFDLQSKVEVGTTITLTFTYDSSIKI